MKIIESLRDCVVEHQRDRDIHAYQMLNVYWAQEQRSRNWNLLFRWFSDTRWSYNAREASSSANGCYSDYISAPLTALLARWVQIRRQVAYRQIKMAQQCYCQCTKHVTHMMICVYRTSTTARLSYWDIWAGIVEQAGAPENWFLQNSRGIAKHHNYLRNVE